MLSSFVQCDNEATATQTITVIDNTPPQQSVVDTDFCMWPPNHGMHCFSAPKLTMVHGEDNCDVSFTISDPVCDSNELPDDTGDGSTSQDCYYDAPNDKLCVRAERQGTGSGRIYTITFEATDDCGNSADFIRKIAVPHDTTTFELENPGKTVEADCIKVKKPRSGKRKKDIFNRMLRG